MKKILIVLTITTLIFSCKKEDDAPTTNTSTEVEGCTDALAANFDPLANTSNNTCCYIPGCTNALAVNYNPDACWNDGSCIIAIEGCTDSLAYNYNTLANTDDGSCIYPPSVLKLSSITINEMPMTNNGATWDWDITGLTSDPDVFYVLKQGGGDIASSSSQDNISTFPISFTEDLPYEINNLSQEYTIYLYDSDVGGEELIGSCSFTPNEYIAVGGDEINIPSNGIDMTLDIEWLE